MEALPQMIHVDPDDGFNLNVHFADGTCARYRVEELEELRPCREPSSIEVHGAGVSDRLALLDAKLDHADGVIVRFSDGTEGAYVSDELLELRPERESSPLRLPV